MIRKQQKPCRASPSLFAVQDTGFADGERGDTTRKQQSTCPTRPFQCRRLVGSAVQYFCKQQHQAQLSAPYGNKRSGCNEKQLLHMLRSCLYIASCIIIAINIFISTTTMLTTMTDDDDDNDDDDDDHDDDDHYPLLTINYALLPIINGLILTATYH